MIAFQARHGLETRASRGKNACRIDIGLFKTDPNKSGCVQAWELFSRFTWQLPQTIVGNGYSHTRNVWGAVDRVDYLGGATFATNENSKNHNGITFGSYVNMNIRGNISGEFDSWVTTKDPMYMHEYGHYLDSQEWGLIYLFAIGIPSGISAMGNDYINKWDGKYVSNPYDLYTHDVYWTEMRANRQAKKYFGKYYGVDWEENVYPEGYPTKNPFK